MFEPKPSLTRILTGASYSLQASQSRSLLWGALALLLILGAGFVLMFHPASAESGLRAEIARVQAENQKLRGDLEELGLKYQQEQTTRASLEHELATQAEDLKAARKDLSFYRANNARQGQ